MNKNENDTIRDAKIVWLEKKSKMTATDWKVVGNALTVGRKAVTSDPLFGQWCKDEGFGDMKREYRANAIWLATLEGWSFYCDIVSHKTLHNPVANNDEI